MGRSVLEVASDLVAVAGDPETLPVVAYFSVLGLALGVVVVAWARACLGAASWRAVLGMAASLPLALTALYVCWGAIFAFMMEQSKEVGCGPGLSPGELLGCSTPLWMEKDVFVQAYVDVTCSLVGWQSSSQLLMFVLSGCTFLHAECRQRGVGRTVSACYILVGFLGAISLAFPLLFAHLFALGPGKGAGRTARLSLPLVLCNLAAMVGVVLLPMTFESHRRSVYTVALLLVHVVLGLPCVVGRPELVDERGLVAGARAAFAAFYAFLAGASLLIHVFNVSRALLSLTPTLPFSEAVMEVMLGPFGISDCQFSISMDVVFTSIAAGAYMVGSRPARGTVCALLTPLLSIAVTFPTFLALELVDQIQLDAAAKTKTL